MAEISDQAASPPPAGEIERQSPLFNRFGLPFCKFVVGVFFFLFGPVRVIGKYRVPKKGGVLILANHQSDLDPPAVQVFCPRTVYFMAKSELFDMKLIGKMIRWFKAFPVKRGEPDKGSIKRAVAYLRAGETVCVFPEGELSETGELLPMKAGVALIVRMSEAQVICLGFKGTRKIMPCGSLLPRPAFGGVSATWGEPRTFEKKAEPEEIMGWVEGQLRELTGQTID